MFIVNHRKLFFYITGVIIALAIGSIAFYGLPLGIDFTGGSLVKVSYSTQRPTINILKTRVATVSLGNVSIRNSGAHDVVLRSRTLTPKEHTALLTALSTKSSKATELQFTSVGPTLGSELGRKALVALLVVVLTIVLYITWAFRRVSKPVSSWAYGAIVVAILVHDLIVPIGFYALWEHFTGAQAGALFVVGLLTVLGYSVNDTIVIFDRVRENLARNQKTSNHEEFSVLVGRSIRETMSRSINTSLTVVIALAALALLGSTTTVNFTLVMLVGVIAGTYSSILLAAPLLIPVAEYFTKKRS